MDGLVSTKHLTAEQELAIKFPKTKPYTDTERSGTPNDLIGTAVTQELEAHGISEAEINTRGLRIKTTIDRNAQSGRAIRVSGRRSAT